MSLTLEIVSHHSRQLGKARFKTFGQDGGTIGRSMESDWCLPDELCFLSNRHASIDFRSGSYYIVDMSKNGVFVNDADEPVGRGKPQRLFPGDRIRIGDYEMAVNIESADDAEDSFADSGHIDPVDARERVAPPSPTGYDLVNADDLLAGAEVEMILEGDEPQAPNAAPRPARSSPSPARQATPTRQTQRTPPPPPARHTPPPAQARHAPTFSPHRGGAQRAAPSAQQPTAPQQRPAATGQQPAGPRQRPAAPPQQPTAQRQQTAPRPQPTTQTQRPAAPRQRPAAPRQRPAANHTPQPPNTAPYADEASTLNAFFRGAGFDAPNLSTEQAEQLMMKLGEVTLELIAGVLDCLRLRSLQKAELKQADTIIQPLDNNRLKFSANSEEAFSRLFLDDSDAYISSAESVRNAFADLREHQSTLLQATRDAVNEYLDRLEPNELEQRASSGRRAPLINAANKFRYWDLYKDVYSILANHPPDELPQPFVDALADAYEKGVTETRKKASVTNIKQAG